MRTIFLTVVMACFSFLLSYAQPVVKAFADKNEILIGQQFTLKIETEFDNEAFKLKSITVPDSLQHFEILARSKPDSVYKQSQLSGITQQFTLTSFDSGKWTLPSFVINFEQVKDDTTITLFTDSLPVTVSFSVSDTTNQLKDIKPIRQAEEINTLWYWIGSVVLLIALVTFLTWFYRYWRKNKGSIPFKTKALPYEEAMKELASLQQLNLSSAEEIRTFHTRLAEILKRYLSRKKGNNYLTKTTGDVLIILKESDLNKETLSKVAAGLRCGDAVKFAKYIPPRPESEVCLQTIKEAIGFIEQQTNIAQVTPPANKISGAKP